MIVKVTYNNSQKGANLVTSFWAWALLLLSGSGCKSFHTARRRVMSPSLGCGHNGRLSIPQTRHICLPAPLAHALLLTCNRLLPPAPPPHLYPTHPSNLSVGKSSWVSPLSAVPLFAPPFRWCALGDWQRLMARDLVWIGTGPLSGLARGPCLEWHGDLVWIGTGTLSGLARGPCLDWHGTLSGVARGPCLDWHGALVWLGWPLSSQHLAKCLTLPGTQQTLVNKMASSNSSWVDLWPTSCISAHSSVLL